MTPSSNETLERIARRIPIPEPAYERVLRRRRLGDEIADAREKRVLEALVGAAGIGDGVGRIGLVYDRAVGVDDAVGSVELEEPLLENAQRLRQLR